MPIRVEPNANEHRFMGPELKRNEGRMKATELQANPPSLYKSCLPCPLPSGSLPTREGRDPRGHWPGWAPAGLTSASSGSALNSESPLEPLGGLQGNVRSPPQTAFWISGLGGTGLDVFKSFWGASSVKPRLRTFAQVNGMTVLCYCLILYLNIAASGFITHQCVYTSSLITAAHLEHGSQFLSRLLKLG